MARKQEAGESEGVMSYKQDRESEKPEARSKVEEWGSIRKCNESRRTAWNFLCGFEARGHTTELCGVTTEVPLERKTRHTTCLYRSTL